MALENRSVTDLQKRMNDGGYQELGLLPNDPPPPPPPPVTPEK